MRESRGIGKYLSVLLLVVLFNFLPSIVFAGWTFEDVDAPKWFTNFYPRAIAFDSLDRPHIAYGGDHLYHAYLDGADWQYEIVDNSTGVGQYAAIAVDSNNKVHISYFDATNGDLKYATNASGSWVIQTLDSSEYVGLYPSIAVDSNNRAHISYYAFRYDNYLGIGDLRYATNASGSWVIQTLDGIEDVGSYTSIAVDSNNKVHISYFDATNGDLKYATNASGYWEIESIDSTGNVGSYTSIALDSNNKVHISYSDGYPSYDLKYATNTSGSWVTQILDSTGNVGSYTSIALDSNNKVHISYSDGYPSYDLKYATNTSGSWVIQTLDNAGDTGLYTSIAVDSNNYIHIIYYDEDNCDLKYATNDSGSWVIQTLDTARNVGEYASLAVDSNNYVHISYYDRTIGDLKYATNDSGSWVTQTVDSVGIYVGPYDGIYASLALDSNNKVHISYWDKTSGNLKYATNASGSWVTQTVDSTRNVGASTSIAVDSNNKVHISYYDSINCGLNYATNASGSWVIQTLDNACSIHYSYTSIALDSNNKIHISYLGHIYSGSTYYGLKYATDASGSWVIETVDSTKGTVGAYASIALDSNNKIHISYVRIGGYNYDLKYTTNASGSWVIQTLDSVAYGAGHNSITLDSNDKVHISYRDNGLKYITDTSGLWVTQALDGGGAYSSIAIHSNEVHIGYYANYHLKYTTNVPMCGDGFCGAGEDCVTCQADCGQCTTIGYSPTSFSFSAVQGGSNPPNQTLSIWNVGGGTLNWAVNDSATWLSLTPTSGTGSGTVTVSVDISGLTAGTYNAMITVTGRGAPPVSSAVTLTIIPPPTIGYSPTNFNFTATQGGSNPSSQTLSITNTGGATLNWSVSDNATWLSLNPTNGTNSGTVTLSVNIAGLSAGTYNATITITAPGATNSPVSIPVTLTVNPPPPTIGYGPSSFSFTTTQGGSNPSNQSLSISNTGGSTLSWSVSDNATWLSLSPTSGTNSGTVTVSVIITGLTEGTYNATITITAAGATNSPVNIPVTLTINAPSTITLLSPNGGEAIPSGSTYSIHWSAPIEALKFTLRYSINNGSTWKLIAANAIGTSYNWSVPVKKANKTNCLIKVTGYDYFGMKVGEDISDSTFTIEVVKLTSPNGVEVLHQDNMWTITWRTNATIRPVASVKLSYSTNGGSTWKAIRTLTGNPGSHNWTIPNVSSSSCQVKVMLKDAGGITVGSDMSDGVFTIQ